MTKSTTHRAATLAIAPTEPDWYRIENKKKKADEPAMADVFVYGTIGGGWFDDGPTAAQFAKDIAGLEVDTINLYVNSPGGSVYDGISMRNALKRHPANVIAHVDGIAASAASFLVTAGDEVVMGENTELMIHDALTIAMGNATEFRQIADELDRVSDNIASMYAAKAGGDAADWRALMLAETWYSAEEAVEAGLADRVAGEAKADPENTADLSMFNYQGRSKSPAPTDLSRIAAVRATYPDTASFHDRFAALVAERRPKRPAEPGSSTPNNTQKGVDPMADLKKELANRLGLKIDGDNVTDEVILSAVDEALAEQVADKPAALTVPAGAEIVDSTVLADLRRKAALGAEARAEQISTKRDAIVNDALTKGKITAASKQAWRDALEASEESTVKVLDALAEGTIVNTVEHGHVGGLGGAADDSQMLDELAASIGWGSTDISKEA